MINHCKCDVITQFDDLNRFKYDNLWKWNQKLILNNIRAARGPSLSGFQLRLIWPAGQKKNDWQQNSLLAMFVIVGEKNPRWSSMEYDSVKTAIVSFGNPIAKHFFNKNSLKNVKKL